jgi:hypothetical protein
MDAPLYRHIEKTRRNPSLYLGKKSLSLMQAYIDGFRAALRETQTAVTGELFPLPFGLFSEYNRTDGYPRRITGTPPFIKTEPYYIEPAAVYAVELTDNTGCLCLVNDDSRNELERTIFKNRKKVEDYLYSCFGSPLNWEIIEITNIENIDNFSCDVYNIWGLPKTRRMEFLEVPHTGKA